MILDVCIIIILDNNFLNKFFQFLDSLTTILDIEGLSADTEYRIKLNISTKYTPNNGLETESSFRTSSELYGHIRILLKNFLLGVNETDMIIMISSSTGFQLHSSTQSYLRVSHSTASLTVVSPSLATSSARNQPQASNTNSEPNSNPGKHALHCLSYHVY